MAIRTGVTWASSTWNCWQGCHKVSAGCKNCYMYRDMKSYGRRPEIVIRSSYSTFNYPLTWSRNKSLAPGSRIFVCSWSDFFIEEADPWRDEAWDIIKRCPMYNFLIPTKRIERAETHLPKDWEAGYKHVWIGISAENQAMFDQRYAYLKRLPAYIKWISAEPLLETIAFPEDDNNIDWIVTGGESGPGYRTVDKSAFISARDYCARKNIPFFHKQNGGYTKIDGAWGGSEIDGIKYEQFPVDLPF